MPTNSASYSPSCAPPLQSMADQGQHARAPPRASSCHGSLDADKMNYDRALQYLFSRATQDPAARDLCREIELEMSPPFRDGVLQCLLRLQAIGRTEEWPVLFGKNNPFILHMLKRICKNEFSAGCDTEKMTWDLRRKETADWLKQRRK